MIRTWAPAFFLGLGLIALAGMQAAAQTGSKADAQAGAQAGAPKGLIDPQATDEPIEILSEQGMEWRRNENLFIARGDARAIQGDTTLQAQELRAHYKEEADGETRVWRIEAKGQVVIKAARGTVRGDTAVYDLETGTMTVTGSALRAESEDYWMTATDSLQYDLRSRRAIAKGDALLVQGERRLRADRIMAMLDQRTDKKGGNGLAVSKVDAVGSVQILSDQGVIEAARGVYDLDKQVASFVGQVTIRQGKNRITGCGGEVNLETGVSRLSRCPGRNGRVQGVFFPRSRTPAPGN